MNEYLDKDCSPQLSAHERLVLRDEPKHIDETVGKRLKSLRKKRLLTQQSLAKGLGVSYQQIQKYETGVNRISAGRLYCLAEILGVDIRYFFPQSREDSGDTLLKTQALNEPIRRALSRLITVITDEYRKSN